MTATNPADPKPAATNPADPKQPARKATSQPADEPAVDNTPEWATGPTDVPAAGGDPDSQLRELKHQLARAEATDDGSTAETLRKDIERVQKQVRDGAARADAAARRDAAANGDAEARTRAPKGRTATPPAKATTAPGTTTVTAPGATTGAAGTGAGEPKAGDTGKAKDGGAK